MNRSLPYVSITVLLCIAAGAALAGVICTQDPSYMNLGESAEAPSLRHWFGTDSMGRDVFAGIWYGGRLSLTIGVLAAAISTTVAVIYGAAAGLAGSRFDSLLMRLSELFMSIPQILLVIFLQAVMGEATVLSMAAAIGLTSWMPMAKVVRSEARQAAGSDYISAARTMGGSFLYILKVHLLPNVLPSVMFMIVTNIGAAIALEATLSFFGIGLPIGVITWGSMLSLSQQAAMSGAWWLLLIPGIFLAATLICIAEIGEYFRSETKRERIV